MVSGSGGQLQVKPASQPRDRPALQNQRGQNDKIGHVEVLMRVRHGAKDRDDGEEDGDRSAQADPGDEQGLLAAEAERPQARRDGDRAGDEDQAERDDRRRHDVGDEIARRHQEPEHEEHDDLADPGEPIVEPPNQLIGAQSLVAGDDAGEVDRQEPAATHDLRAAVNDQRRGDGEHRVEPRCELEAVHRPRQGVTAGNPDKGAEAKLEEELLGDHPGHRVVPSDHQLNQSDGEKHRHGVVGAGFDFERGVEAPCQIHATLVQQQKDGRGVGRSDDGADQETFEEPDAKRPHGDRAGDRRGDDDSKRGKRRRRRPRHAHGGERRAQAAVEQNHRERHAADEKGGVEIVEGDAKNAVFAGEHAEAQEHEQQRRADPRRNHAGDDADDQKTAGKQDQVVDGFHRLRVIPYRVLSWRVLGQNPHQQVKPTARDDLLHHKQRDGNGEEKTFA